MIHFKSVNFLFINVLSQQAETELQTYRHKKQRTITRTHKNQRQKEGIPNNPLRLLNVKKIIIRDSADSIVYKLGVQRPRNRRTIFSRGSIFFSSSNIPNRNLVARNVYKMRCRWTLPGVMRPESEATSSLNALSITALQDKHISSS